MLPQKKAAAQELDLGSFEAKIALRVAVPSEGLESKASPNKNWTWVVSGTKICVGFLCGTSPVNGNKGNNGNNVNKRE